MRIKRVPARFSSIPLAFHGAISTSRLGLGGPLVFEIERGHLGSTEVGLMRYEGGEPPVVERLPWDGIAPGERNTHMFEVPVSRLVGGEPRALGALRAEVSGKSVTRSHRTALLGG